MARLCQLSGVYLAVLRHCPLWQQASPACWECRTSLYTCRVFCYNIGVSRHAESAG